MNNMKIIYFCLFAFLIVLIGLTLLKIKHQGEFQQKTVLAKETHQGLVKLMYDLSKAHKNTIRGVKPDGQWHHRIAFYQTGQGLVTYLLKDGRLLRLNANKNLLIAYSIADLSFRRQPQAPDILEVRIVAQKDVSLISNFKIRLRL